MARVISSKPLVFDACALVAYLKGESGARVVDAFLRSGSNQCLAHAVNVCEVYYLALAHIGEQKAQEAIDKLVADGLVIDYTLDEALCHQIGHLKTNNLLLDSDGDGPPLADCFCTAFAQRIGGEIVTSDHNHFELVQQSGICPVRFIR